MTTSLEPGAAPAPAPEAAPAPAAVQVSSPYPEPDKLGLIPEASPPAFGGDEVRGHVLAEVKEAVAAARAAAARAGHEPDEAVHQTRKALRRLRALVDAVGPALPRDVHRTLQRALKDARRTLGPARDRTVAHSALTDVPAELAESARAVVAASIEQAPPPESVQEAIAKAVAEADAQAVALAAALPEHLRAGRLARGVAATYAAARRARRKAKKSESAVHRWRRRSKELIYQLTLFGDHPGAGELRSKLVDVDDDLGHVVDRILLKEFVGMYGGVLDGDAAGALLTHVHDELLAGRDKVRSGSKQLYSLRPRKLKKRLRRALRTPPAPSPDETPATDPGSP